MQGLTAYKEPIETVQAGLTLLKTPYELYNWLNTGVGAVIRVVNLTDAKLYIEGAGATKKSEGIVTDDLYVKSISKGILKPGDEAEITLQCSDWFNSAAYVAIKSAGSAKCYLQGVYWDAKDKTYLGNASTTDVLSVYPRIQWDKTKNMQGLHNKHALDDTYGTIQCVHTTSTGNFTIIEVE